MLKLISYILSFAIVFSSVTPSLAQVQASRRQNFPFQVSASNALSDAVERMAAKAMQDGADAYWIERGSAMAKEQCSLEGWSCMLDQLYKARQEANGKIEEAVVCSKDGTECIPALAYAWGGIHYGSKHLFYYNNDIIVETAAKFAELVGQFGIYYEADRSAARAYFKDLLENQAPKDCTNGAFEYGSANHRADQRHAADLQAQRCAAEVAVMPVYAMLSKSAAEQSEVNKIVYKLMKSKYDTQAAIMVVQSGVTALGVLGTQEAYKSIETFLTDVTMPSTLGNIWSGIGEPVKVTAQNSLRVASNVRGGNSRYLNRINEQFQYVDNTEAKRQGFNITSWQSERRQYPYGNMLEDIGAFLGQESGRNAYARALAKKLVAQANTAAKNNTNAAGVIHYPVVLGILDGWRAHGKDFIYEPSPALLELFYKGDWFDLNEGTQRRVHYKAYQFAKARGWTWKAPVKDNAKVERSVYNERLISIGKGADAFVMVLMTGYLFASIPSLARGIPQAVRALRSRQTWVGVSNYFRQAPKALWSKVKGGPVQAKAVSQKAAVPQAVVKPSTVKPASATKAVTPKPTAAPKAVANKPLATSSAVEPTPVSANTVMSIGDANIVDVGNGTLQWLTPGQQASRIGQPAATFASQGEGFANVGKVQQAYQAGTTAQKGASVTAKAPVVKGPQPYILGQTTNSLGQTVPAWVKNPAYEAYVELAKPTRHLSWLDRMRLQWTFRVQPVLDNLATFGKSRYSLMAVGPGAAPVSSEAAISQALLQEVPSLVRSIQLERSMFISENALRVGATGTRMTTSNLGGLASQGFARASAKVATQTAVKTVANPGMGQLVAEVARPLTRGNRFWSRVAMIPGLGFANRWATPKVDKISFAYQKVWFNTRTQTIEYAQNTKEIPNGFKVFTVSSTPLFIAQPEIDQQALDAIVNKLTEDAEKEARQTGEPVNRKVLRARIEKEQNNLPAAIAIRKANLIAQYILESQQAQREDFVWVLASDASPSYKIQANQKMQQLYMKPVTLQELLVKRMNLQRQVNLKVSLKKDELSDIAEKVSGRLLQENLGQLVPQDDPLLSQGLTWRELTNVDQDRLTEALYPQENIEDLLRYSTRENFSGNTVYDKVLPVYVRDVMGDVGEKPQLYLLLNKPFIMPRGFRVVIDESGHFKFASYNLRAVSTSRKPYNRVLKRIYKWQPNFLDKLPWVKNNPRRLQEWDSSARRLVFETPLKASELTALNYILSNRPGQVAVLPTAPNDTFEPLMTWTVPIVAGADLGASLSSQLKKTLTSEAAITGTSGGGFASPWAANFFSPLINKYGYYRALQVGFLTMLVLSAIGMTAGLWIPEVAQLLATLSGSEELMEKALKLTVSESSMLGMFKPGASNVHLGLSLIWMSAAMVTASVFSMLAGPILKSTYTDPTIFSSKNMEFTTNKGFSRMLVASGLGAILKIVKGTWGIDLNWSILVPAMFVLSGVGLVQLRGSRLYKEHQALQREKAQMKEDVNLSTQETKQKAEFEKAQARQFAAKMKEKYATTFAKPLKSVTNRLGLIYLTYGNVNSVILGMLAGILYSPSTALFISAAGYFASWLVRKAADRLIKSRVITEDQLTGMSLPLMLAGVATGLVAPFGSVSMAAFFALMYLSTPTFGVSENTRMMNYIASYYKAKREQVNKNENLSITEKEEQLKAFNKEQEAMKVAAAVSYNNHNSMGIFPILATTALVAVTKDSWLGTAVSQQMSEWVKYAADMLRIGTDAAAYDIKKAAGAPLDFAIYRLALLPAVAFGMILNWTNVGMIKQGIKRLFSSIAVSKQDIADVEHSDILSDLQIDFRNINSTIEEISREVEELDAAIRPFKGSRTTEERLQGWANRMVWVNNRLKAITQAKPILLNRLKPEMRTMRELSKNFMLLLNYNDVSDALRQQGAALYQSLGFMQIEGEPYSTAKERFANLIDSLAIQTLNEEQKNLVAKIKMALEENDISQFPFLVRSLALGVSGNIKQSLIKTGREVEDEMILSTLNLDNPGLQYLPELKLSAWDALRHQLRIGKDPAKGIFAGADVDGYEQAKLLLREMRTMTKEATNGIITDGMFEQFNSFYNKAINYLQDYVRKNMTRGQSEKMDSRVMVLKQEMDELYRQYLNKEPPEVTFDLQPNLEAVEDSQLAPAY